LREATCRTDREEMGVDACQQRLQRDAGLRKDGDGARERRSALAKPVEIWSVRQPAPRVPKNVGSMMITDDEYDVRGGMQALGPAIVGCFGY
jgi:hypothetical protein